MSLNFITDTLLKEVDVQEPREVSLEPDLSGLLQHLVDITELIVRIKKGNFAGVGVH